MRDLEDVAEEAAGEAVVGCARPARRARDERARRLMSCVGAIVYEIFGWA
ncbi:hypothetical protein [Candidatus Ichthyocystis sparus]|nr:hypothetical protein [Candidatus Ichthyocystis sparus]